ncbi:MAG TPA: rhodanese-like domain-containing protein [bacterium]|nr:rhodanese-like domain-containing protein [bacterium]
MAFTKEQVLKELKSDGVVILNVLPAGDYAKLHIKHSRNLPWGDGQEAFARGAEAFGRDKFFITYCAGPGCSAGPEAARFLKEKGFRAEDYPGGMEEWHENGLPVEGSLASASLSV